MPDLSSPSSPAVQDGGQTFLADLLHRARRLGPRRVAMVYPCDLGSLEASRALTEQGIAKVALLGPRARISELGERHGIDLSPFELIDGGPDAERAAELACRLAASGEVDMLMKGSLHTDELMRAVVSRSHGLRTSRRISHAFAMQVPGRQRPLIISDCVVNVAPTLPEKVEILKLAVELAQAALEIQRPRVALISFTESVLPAAQSTLDAAVIAKMAQRGQISDAVIDGPLAFDNAVSPTSAASKGVTSEVAGAADMLLMPNLETGNALYKSLVYMAGATCAGVLLGTQSPVILTSRTDSVESKVFSVALGSLSIRPQTQAPSH